jgi:hypothetical protein
MLCGHPDNPEWESVHVEVANSMWKSQCRIRRTKKNSRHRQGNFTTLAAGVSFGGGQKVGGLPTSNLLPATNLTLQVPGNLVNTPANMTILNELLESSPFIRIARFSNGKYFAL